MHAAEPAFERVDAVLMTFELPVPTVRETIDIARGYGVPVSCSLLRC